MKQSYENKSANFVALRLIECVVRPLSRLLMRSGGTAQDMEQLARWHFVQSFYETPALWRKDKPTVLQCALKTGLSRTHIDKQLKCKHPKNNLTEYRHNKAARVLEGWLHDKDFQVNGRPAILPLSSPRSTDFKQLVHRYAADSRVNNILDDLVSASCIEVEDGCVSIVNPVYGVQHAEAERLEIISYMTNRLLETSDHNIFSANLEERWFQRYWVQRQIPIEKLTEARSLITWLSLEAGRRIDTELAKLADEERRPGVEYADLGVSMYYFEDRTSYLKTDSGEIDSPTLNSKEGD